MELILLRKRLLEGLNSVDKAIGGGDKLPILKNIKLKATDKNKIVLTSTNLEVAIEKKVSGKVVESGEVIIPFDVFSSIIKNLDSEKINIIEKDNKIEIKADNYQAEINCEDPEEYPVIPTVDNKSKSIEINGEIFKNALKQSLTATKHSDIRPEINGVYFNYSNKSLILAGTDSFRLVEKVINQKDIKCNFDNLEIIVPLETVKILTNNIKDDDTVEIFTDPNQVMFETDSVSIISRLVDGEFPDYKNVIPKETKKDISINREELYHAIKTTKTFSGKTNEIVFKIGDKNKVLEIYSVDNSLGENNYRVPIKTKGTKSGLSITFNWRYILDSLKVFDEDKKITLGLNSSDKPVMVKGDSNSTTYVVMPVRS